MIIIIIVEQKSDSMLVSQALIRVHQTYCFKTKHTTSQKSEVVSGRTCSVSVYILLFLTGYVLHKGLT